MKNRRNKEAAVPRGPVVGRRSSCRWWLILAAVFLVCLLPAAGRDSVVVFNEVHYQPAGDESTLEYLEFYNQLAVDVDLSNWRIDGDVEFDFPDGTIIGARDYLVVARDPGALSLSTGQAGALGPYQGFLSNSGGALSLYNNNRSFSTVASAGESSGAVDGRIEGRRIMDQLEYADHFPWPVGPDGSGFSLAKVDPGTGTAEATNWSVSATSNGSPGITNSTEGASELSFNEVSAVTDPNFRIELRNTGSAAVLLGGLIIASSDPAHPDYVFPASSLAGGGFLTLDAATLGFIPADNNRLFLFGGSRASLIDAVRADDRALARHPAKQGRWLRPDFETFGSTNSFAIEDAVVINEVFYHAPAKPAVSGTPGSSSVVQVLDYDSTWRYNLDAGAEGLPSGWASASHPVDGTSWEQGPGLLGEENKTLGEPIRTQIALSSKVAYYFETEFNHSGTGTVSKLVIDHYIDDGAIFYLNGTVLDAFNLPLSGVTPNTPASPAVGNTTLRTLVVEGPPVVAGVNRLSVEVHQATLGSSDLVFGTRVTVHETNVGGVPDLPFQERDEEWLELHNRGASPVNLTDWQLDGGIGYSFPLGTIIPAGGYLVVAKDAAALASKHPAATVIGDYSGQLGNGGDSITLEDQVGNPADEVRYHDSGKWHTRADGGGSSLELRDPGSDNAIAGAWAPSDERARSSWNTFSYEGVAEDDGIGLDLYNELQIGLLDSGELLIDDVNVVENDSTEFIQNGDFENDAVGGGADKWRVIGNHGSHGQTVVVTDPDDAGNQCLQVVATGATGNRHDKLETTFANSEEVVVGNSYRISFRAKFLSGSSQLNTRLYFNYLQCTHILPTPEIWGTPGAPNSSLVSNTGPDLEGLSHTPVIPAVSQPVTVKIEAFDPDGIGSLTLNYSVNDAAYQTVSMAGSGGTYTGIVPGQAAGAIVRFYVSASDGSGAINSYPAAGSEGGAFYKVQDGLADTSGLRHNFRVIMAETDRAFLFQRTNLMSNDRMSVTIVEDEQTVYYDVGLRLKGSSVGRDGNSSYGFNIRFQPDRLFRGVHRTIAIERGGTAKDLFAKHLNNRAANTYNSSYDDVCYIVPPTVGHRGVGTLHMTRHTNLFFDSIHPGASNPGTLFNQELHYSPTSTSGGVEGLKLPRPSSHTNGQYDLKDRGSGKEPYRWGFQIRSTRDRDDYSQIIALNQALELDGIALEAALEPLVDIDQWMRTFAIMALNGTDDVFTRLWEHNFRFFVRPSDQKVVVMQWDLDRAFGLGTSSPVTPTVNKQGVPVSLAKLYAIPRFERLFHGHIDDLIETGFNSNYTTPWASHFTTVSGFNVNTLPNYVNNRANFVQAAIPATIPFEITTNGGNDFSELDSAVDLAGDGWVDVFTININGIPTSVSWTDGASWQLTAPIGVGANFLELTAFNRHGVQVGADTITVTNTSTVDLADAGNTVVSELHYHPADPSAAEMTAGFFNDEDFEFVEFVNTDPAVAIDFTGVRFTDGVVFDFPAGITLAPGGRLIVVANQAAFEFRHGTGGVLIAGEYTGKFSNGGERVRVEAADTSPITDFSYGDAFPWPESADGSGYSLVLSGVDPTEAFDWRPSTGIGGNPGGSDSTSYGGGDLIDYALAADPSYEFLGDAFILKVRVNLAADDAIVEARFSTDLDIWTPAAESDLISRMNHGDGTATLSFVAPFPLNTTAKQFGVIHVKTR